MTDPIVERLIRYMNLQHENVDKIPERVIKRMDQLFDYEYELRKVITEEVNNNQIG